MNKKTILITGGAGFIGSHVNKLLHQSGYDTIVVDDLSRGNSLAVLYGTFIEGNIGNSSLLDRIFDQHKIAAVMHFAAFTDVGESMHRPDIYYQNNVVQTLTLLRTMLKHQVRNFIFSSSAAIFGIPQEGKLVKENDPCNPINPYGRSKLIVEQILQDFDHAYHLKSICLRYFNAAGGDPEAEIRNYKSKESNLIPVILQSLKQPNGKFTIFGTNYPTPDGTCIRDYVHIWDLGKAHIQAMEKIMNGAPSTSYNLGNGQGFSVREVIAAAEKVTGLKVNVVEGDRRAGDPSILIADSHKAHQELNWKPQYPDLEAMVRHAWQAL